MVTEQLADMTTHGLPTCRLVSLRTRQVTDWTARGLLNSRTGQLADAASNSSI